METLDAAQQAALELAINDGGFQISADIDQSIKKGGKFDLFDAPAIDPRIKSRFVLDAYLKKYQAMMDAQYQGMQPMSEFGTLNPFSYLDARYAVHPRELEAIDRDVAAVMRTMVVADRIFRGRDVGRGRTKFLHYQNKDPLDPVLSKNFKTYQPGKEAVEEETVYFLGVHKDYEFGMVELDASRLTDYLQDDILSRTTREFTALVMDFRERILWRGGDIRSGNNKNIDARVMGFINWTGIQTQAVVDFTAIGNATTAVVNSIKALKDYYFRPPYHIVCSPWVYIQLLKNRHTYSNKTEIWEILNLGKEAGDTLISGISVTPHLLKVDETTTTGAMYVFSPKDNSGKDNIFIAESYPMWHYPLTLGTQIGVVELQV